MKSTICSTNNRTSKWTERIGTGGRNGAECAIGAIIFGNTNYQNKGIAYQTYRILLAYGFHILGLERIYGGCNEQNIAMIKVYAKLGYKEGVLRRNDYINGGYSDHLLFGILKEEFLEKNNVELKY
jgi:RimJ/RimL family protein N-acetyltransferase